MRKTTEVARTPALEFVPIDFRRHSDLCVAWRIDSYVVSFGDATAFHARAGVRSHRYLQRLRLRSRDLPGSCVHVWLDGEPVGQIELRRVEGFPEHGYVSLVYLAPPWRGRGLGAELDRYITEYFQALAIRHASLHVSPSNSAARRYYARCGWRDTGVLEGDPPTLLLERTLVSGPGAALGD